MMRRPWDILCGALCAVPRCLKRKTLIDRSLPQNQTQTLEVVTAVQKDKILGLDGCGDFVSGKDDQHDASECLAGVKMDIWNEPSCPTMKELGPGSFAIRES